MEIREFYYFEMGEVKPEPIMKKWLLQNGFEIEKDTYTKNHLDFNIYYSFKYEEFYVINKNIKTIFYGVNQKNQIIDLIYKITGILVT